MNARSEKYAYNNANANSKPQSRFMALLGSAILLFIVVHMANFWAKMHFGELGTYKYELQELKPLYLVVVAFFKHPDYGMIAAILYAVSMVVLGFHLSHGFAAGFQSLGINHPKYNPIIKKVGTIFSVLVPVLFAAIPLYVAFGLDIEYEYAEGMLERIAESSKK